MAYPEPIPALRGRDAKEFVQRLNRFELKASQLKLYAGAREAYRKKSSK